MWSASALCWSSTAYPKNNNGALTGAGRLEAKASGFFLRGVPNRADTKMSKLYLYKRQMSCVKGLKNHAAFYENLVKQKVFRKNG